MDAFALILNFVSVVVAGVYLGKIAVDLGVYHNKNTAYMVTKSTFIFNTLFFVGSFVSSIIFGFLSMGTNEWIVLGLLIPSWIVISKFGYNGGYSIGKPD